MLRIGVTSDIHISVTPLNRAIVPHLVRAADAADLDVLVICGDISPSLMNLARCLGEFEPLNCDKLFVAGNHDIWVVAHQQVTSNQKYRAIDAICTECGFHHLPAAPQIIEGVGFCGTIGWYDYSFRREEYDIPLAQYETKKWGDSLWQDAHYARWEASDLDMTEEFNRSLRRQLDDLPASLSHVVVVTHHVPFRECVTYRDQLSSDFFRAYMGNETLGQICQGDPRVKHVLFGHTHQKIQKRLGRIDAISSPVGYLLEHSEGDLERYAQERLTVFEVRA